jgi:tRNA-2-methylthio-N6-dimethylallyladenosine synthase
VGRVDGIERVRFTSPHPAAFSDDVIDAMAETPTVMPQLHMPLQSGSDTILKAMRRSYRSTRFLSILDRVRDRIPHAAITTDIIVGFPGETEDDFRATLDVVEASRFSQAFTFQYSIRPGTPAATMSDQVPKELVQERFKRLTALQDRIGHEENRALIGTEQRVLVNTAPDDQHGRFSGRAEDNRLVHVGMGDRTDAPRPGDVVTVTIDDAKPYFLLSDSGFATRATRAGDAHDRAQAESCGTPAPGASAGASTSLGMPALRPGLGA